QLAVVAPQMAGEEELQPARDEGVALDVDARGKALVEGARDDEVGELVEDDVHAHATFVGGDEGLPEALADRVPLPDVGLEVDAVLRGVDVREHVREEVLAEGVDAHVAAGDRHGPVGLVRELPVRAVLAAEAVEDEQPGGREELGGEDGRGGSAQQPAALAPAVTAASSAHVHGCHPKARPKGATPVSDAATRRGCTLTSPAASSTSMASNERRHVRSGGVEPRTAREPSARQGWTRVCICI